MTRDIDPTMIRFYEGNTATDFANLVAERRTAGDEPVRVHFEDFTIPDSLIFLEARDMDGTMITYAELFLGALQHLHKLAPTAYRAVANPDMPEGQPFSMSLELSFAEPTP
jgi:hypothetical protein